MRGNTVADHLGRGMWVAHVEAEGESVVVADGNRLENNVEVGIGIKGACTVDVIGGEVVDTQFLDTVIDNKAVRSCVYPVRNANGREVRTIEGLSSNGELHPLQKAFVEHDALQCGFCTPGMILTAYSLLRDKPQSTREEIIQGMDHNLCRCGAHTRIIDAIQSAARAM